MMILMLLMMMMMMMNSMMIRFDDDTDVDDGDVDDGDDDDFNDEEADEDDDRTTTRTPNGPRQTPRPRHRKTGRDQTANGHQPDGAPTRPPSTTYRTTHGNRTD